MLFFPLAFFSVLYRRLPDISFLSERSGPFYPQHVLFRKILPSRFIASKTPPFPKLNSFPPSALNGRLDGFVDMREFFFSGLLDFLPPFLPSFKNLLHAALTFSYPLFSFRY